jgi:hypothetical protein
VTAGPPKVRLLRHSESFEVRYASGAPSKYFYFDDDPIRRGVRGRVTSAEAETAAKTFAREERDRLSA